MVGKPNVGKSTLINLLLKFPLAVVTPKPQTTRDRILGVLNGENYQIAIWDTPGLLRRPMHLLHKHMIEDALAGIEEADLILMLVEPYPPTDEDIFIIGKLKEKKKKSILVINKIDLVKTPEVLPVMNDYSRYNFSDIVPISALKGANIDELFNVILRNLPEGEPLFSDDYVTDRPERFFVKEIIRGVLYETLGKEVPYSTAVKIEEFKERAPAESGKKEFIRAIIYVDKDSQRPIILGKRGGRIKKIGTVARERIEDFLGRPVFLELWVKVKPKWRKDPVFLRSLKL